jgi:glyoxylase-like metal-dependent hydrolase (beta-lactamase superfamily II)
MTLEDHVGDVVRKARLALGIDADRAAVAAGVSFNQWTALEESGRTAASVDWTAVGGLLQLDPAKLRGLAEGWLPDPVHLREWRELRVITTDSGGMAVNAYLIWDETTREAALFDTGWEAEPVLALIGQHQLGLRHLFITHSHHDHLAALDPIRAAFPQVRLHSSSPHAPPDQRNRADERVAVGRLRVAPRATPGHAADGVTYVVEDWPGHAPAVAVVGDAIFAGSMGKAVGQASVLAKQKVIEHILSLPEPTLVCPGHGPLTTVGQERRHNPFFAYPCGTNP